MKIKLPFLFLFLAFQFGFSQTEKLILGRILCNDFPLQGIEIVNLVTKKSAIADTNGRFSISAKVDDMLVFISEKYDYKRLILDQEFLDKNNFIIVLTRKPEELDEVVVISKISFPKIKFDKNIASQLTIEKAAKNPKPYGVYDGIIENGIGMTIPLGGGRKKIHEIDFKEFMKKNYNDSFYIEILKLKPEEIGLFIEFCDVDLKSKAVLENTNPLKSLDFLMSKKIEFEKMLISENKYK
jgi:hypothetical protein